MVPAARLPGESQTGCASLVNVSSKKVVHFQGVSLYQSSFPLSARSNVNFFSFTLLRSMVG